MKPSELLPPYNHAVNWVWLNRLTIVLAWAGVFVAGVLGMAHALGKNLPCGVSTGCEIVARHPSSVFLGLPVAFYGLGAYVLLAVLGLWRGIKGLDATRPALWLAVGISAVGLIVSGILTAYAHFTIRATCPWCLASAAIMSLSFFAHIALTGEDGSRKPSGQIDGTLTACCLILALGGVGMLAASMGRAGQIDPRTIAAVKDMPLSDLVKDPATLDGPANAPITIVEFADIYCPGCRSSYAMIRQIIEASNGKIRFGYRHYPLYKKEGHELSVQASAATEFARENGQFWEVLNRLFAADPAAISTLDGVLSQVKAAGLDSNELARRLAAGDEKLLDTVFKDKELGDKLGIQQTPTYFIFAEGLPTRIATSADIQTILREPAYVNLIRGVAPGP